MRRFLKDILFKNKALLMGEAAHLSGFMQLLMKQRNTGAGWTRDEKERLNKYLRHLSLVVPVLMVFALPGGSLLLPLLAEVMDRRKTSRTQQIIVSGGVQQKASSR